VIARGAGAADEGGGTVLLVDDNAAMRALIRSVVAERTATVHECGDADSAVALYRRFRPDWVLMDIGLGGTDGIAATRAIRALDPDARIIIVTQHDDDAHREAAADAGALAYLLKDDLLRLNTLLAGS
jgi:DNA-binding NarL/FixJ family response regulator